MSLPASNDEAFTERLARLPVRGSVARIEDDGMLTVATADGRVLRCECLHPLGASALIAEAGGLRAGDAVLVLPPQGDQAAIVLGRVGPLTERREVENLSLSASGKLTLRCGESAVDLRADGKVMIRGEDVLVRAKGTKRIRAGTVAIN
jgi:hypothetical protein